MQLPRVALLLATAVVGIHASQIPTHSYADMDGVAFAQLPASAFSHVTGVTVAEFNADSCAHLTVRQFMEIPTDSIAGFGAACISNLARDVVAKFDPARFNKLSLQAVGGFQPSISAMPAAVFAQISAQQLQHLSTGPGSACAALGAEQIASIPADVWGEGITQPCLDSMVKRGIEEITADQLLAMSPAKIANLTSAQTKYFGADVCKRAQSVLLSNLNEDAVNGLAAVCWRAMDNDAIASLEDWQLYALSTTGFRGDQWRRLPAAKVTKIYASALNSLSPECCKEMSPDQLEAICRVAISGLNSTCTAELPGDLGRSLDKDRVSQLSPYGIRDMDPRFFQYIRPSAFGNFSAVQVSALSPLTCMYYIRPLQFHSIPITSWAHASAECISALDPLTVQQLTIEHLAAIKSEGWSGFIAMHHHFLLGRFGKAFLEVATLDKIADNNPKKIPAWWRQAQCLDKMFDQGLLNRLRGKYSPNWMTLLSRPKSVTIEQPVLPTTLLAGLRGIDVFNITLEQWPYVPPTEFSTLSAEQFDKLVLANKMLRVIRGEQLVMVSTKVIPGLSSRCLQRLLEVESPLRNWFSCAHMKAITKQQMEEISDSVLDFIDAKLSWCALPVNDDIEYDGYCGQRWSERKKGLTYELECRIAPGDWQEISNSLAEYQREFTRKYKEKQVEPPTGCPCKHRQCISHGDDQVCVEEPAATCQFVPGQSDSTRRQRTVPLPAPSPGGTGSPPPASIRFEKTTKAQSSLSVGAIVGIVVGAVAVVAVAGFAVKRFNLHGKLRERWQYSRVPDMERI